jgi:hypothetical protein
LFLQSPSGVEFDNYPQFAEGTTEIYFDRNLGKFAESGTWTASRGYVEDRAGNKFSFSSGDLVSFGFNPEFLVLPKDGDFDGDGFDNLTDAFPTNGSEWLDNDQDGTGNNEDLDDDGDGVSDLQEISDGTDPLDDSSCSLCFSLDVDKNGEITALSDGLLIIRHLFGFTGEALTTGALAPDSPVINSSEITEYLRGAPSLDIDDDGEIKALTDGLLTIRYLFGFREESLVANAVGPTALRGEAAAISSYLERFNKPKFNSNKLVIATGSAASIINNVAQNGSKFAMQITNNTLEHVELTRFTQESQSGSILLSTRDPNLLGGDKMLEPLEATAIEITVGPLGQQLPFSTNFYYINPESGQEQRRTYEWKVQ